MPQPLTPHLALLGHHWTCAEDPDRAAGYLEQAAEHAWREGRHDAAWSGLRASLALDAPSPGEP